MLSHIIGIQVFIVQLVNNSTYFCTIICLCIHLLNCLTTHTYRLQSELQEESLYLIDDLTLLDPSSMGIGWIVEWYFGVPYWLYILRRRKYSIIIERVCSFCRRKACVTMDNIVISITKQLTPLENLVQKNDTN